MREKERRGNVTILLPHLCFKVAPCSSLESLLSYHFHILVGIFIIELGLYIPMMGFLKCPRSHEQASWMHTHLVSSLSFHTLIALSASVSWQSLLLTLTSIDGHLHSPLISHVDVRLSPFCLLHTTSTIIFYSTYSAISMAHAHVLREGWIFLEKLKYERIAWLKPGLCMIWVFCVTKMKHDQTIWFCRDELSLAMLFWEDIIAWSVCLKYYWFYVNSKLLSWILWIWIFLPQ